VYIKVHNSDQFIEESVDCVGTSAFVIENMACLVNLSTLTAAPYNLVKDESVYAKVIAVNAYG
jgi:hypothetical protein